MTGLFPTISAASLPALNFAAYHLLTSAAEIAPNHRETAGILMALRDEIDREREDRIRKVDGPRRTVLVVGAHQRKLKR